MKEEKIKELKESTISKINDKKSMPGKVDELLKIGFEGILQIYKNCSCDISLIEGYINDNREEVKNVLNKMGENRKAEQIQFVVRFFSRLQTQIEEGQIRESKADFSEMNFKNREITNRIFIQIESAFQNIRTAQRRFLSARGYSQERIFSIDASVNAFVKSLRKNDLIIKKVFDLDEKELQQLLTEKYEEYMQDEDKQNNRLEQTGNKKSENESGSEKEKFKKSLDAGITLEEQKENAQRFAEVKEDSNGQRNGMILLDNVIE